LNKNTQFIRHHGNKAVSHLARNVIYFGWPYSNIKDLRLTIYKNANHALYVQKNKGIKIRKIATLIKKINLSIDLKI